MLKQNYSFFSFFPPFFPFKNSLFFPSNPGLFFFFSACFLCAHSSWLFFFFASCLFIVYSQLSTRFLLSSAMPDYPSFELLPHDSSRCSTPNSPLLSTIYSAIRPKPFPHLTLSASLDTPASFVLVAAACGCLFVQWDADLYPLLPFPSTFRIECYIEVVEQTYFVITSSTEGVKLRTDSVSVSEMGVDLASSTLGRLSGAASFFEFSLFCEVRFFFVASSPIRFFCSTSIFSRKRSRSSSSDFAPNSKFGIETQTLCLRNRNGQTNCLINLFFKLLFTFNDFFSHGFIVFGIKSLLATFLSLFL